MDTMKRFFVFGLGSVAGAVVDFSFGLLLIWMGMPGWLALACAMTVSANLVYVIHQKITFSDLGSSDLHRGRLTVFLLNTALIYVCRVILLEGLLMLGWLPAVALAVALVASVVVNFIISRLYIFK